MPGFKLKIKTGTGAPATGVLETGEFGYDYSNKKVYIGNTGVVASGLSMDGHTHNFNDIVEISLLTGEGVLTKNQLGEWSLTKIEQEKSGTFTIEINAWSSVSGGYEAAVSLSDVTEINNVYLDLVTEGNLLPYLEATEQNDGELVFFAAELPTNPVEVNYTLSTDAIAILDILGNIRDSLIALNGEES
jgi:hypothetical protein